MSPAAAMTTIDVCFVLDCTASMQPWINAAKRQIHTTLDALIDQHPTWEFEVALIVYRDYGDEERISVLDFTPDLHRLDRTLETTIAEGGDDIAEDFASAMWSAARLSWTGQVRHIFVITDAPAHGVRYHRPHISDRFPDGDPQGRVVEDDVDMLTQKRVNLTFVRIHARTDLLIDCLRRVYTLRAHRGVTFRVEHLQGGDHLPPPPFGLERSGASTLSDDTSPTPDMILSRMLNDSITQSLSVHDPTE